MECYVKKPIPIKAVQFVNSWDSVMDVMEMLEASGRDPDTITTSWDDVNECRILHIKTLEGTMMAIPGDYIICGVMNEFYPCKPDIFEATYDKVKQQ